MIDLALPAGVGRRAIQTSRRTVPALRARPQSEEAADHGIDVVMVSGFFGAKEDFRELLAQAGYGGWAYDYQGHRERRQAAARPFIPRQLGTFRSELDDIAAMLAIPDDEAIRLGRLARQVGPVFEQFATAE